MDNIHHTPSNGDDSDSNNSDINTCNMLKVTTKIKSRIHSTEETLNKFARKTIKTSYLQRDDTNLDNFVKSSETTFLKDMVMGKYYDVSYCPYSQKYIDDYNAEAFKGRLIFVDKANDDALFCQQKDKEVVIRSLKTFGSGYGFSNDPGYWHIVSELKPPEQPKSNKRKLEPDTKTEI